MKTVYGFFCALLCLISVPGIASVPQKRVAVVGGGGAGLTTTWLLDQECAVTLYESADRLGGHANSIDVMVDGKSVPIEAGFEFISKHYFARFYNLLKHILKVPLKKYTLTSTFYQTDGSGLVVLPPIADGKVEWGTFTPRNFFELIQIGILMECAEDLITSRDYRPTLQEYLGRLYLTKQFKNEFLYPFLAANWGVEIADIKKFAAYDALKYLVEGKNAEHYKWIEITGGTQQYIQALAGQLRDAQVKLSTQIVDIRYQNGEYHIVEANGTTLVFDHLVIGTNGKIASQLLQHVDEAAPVRAYLDQIRFFKTTVAIHGDPRFMPEDPDDWSVVNIRYNGTHSAMTVYKPWLSPTSPIFKTWLTYDVRSPDDCGDPMPSPLYALAHYDHPITDQYYVDAQRAVRAAQGKHNLWFVGNYTYDDDSHESAILSAVWAANRLAPNSARLQLLTDVR